MATVRRLAIRASDEAYFARVCARAGMLGLEPPGRLARITRAFWRDGLLGGMVSIGAIRHPERPAIRDERGQLTYRELDERTNALANAWRDRGVRSSDGIAVLARNHRGFLVAVFAAAKLGARIVLLNTSFSGPQLREVAARERTDLLVYDDEFAPLVEGLAVRHGLWRAGPASGGGPGDDTLDWLIARGCTAPQPRAGRKPKIVILTSGTTGTPKGAPRDEPRSLGIAGSVLSKVPLRAGQTVALAVPLFHAHGFVNMFLATSLGDTLVLRPQFDAAATLDCLQDDAADVLIVVPVMLQRILELGEAAIRARDLSALKVIFVSGSAVGPELVRRTLRAFGPVLYNMYGSTEMAFATIASPAQLAAAPATVGTPARGTIVKVLDDAGREVPAGTTARIFVANSVQFEGYTGGENKELIRGLMSSGDVGHFDAQGHLFVDGRDDEMIVSGGENVFPAEVEESLAAHPAVREVAVIGVSDEQFGQRLKAFVVLAAGREVTGDELRAHVRENLARYKAPRDVEFLDELPRTQTGKVLKRLLAEPAGPIGER